MSAINILSSYNKVTAKLEEKKINYLSVDRRNNFERMNYKGDVNYG